MNKQKKRWSNSTNRHKQRKKQENQDGQPLAGLQVVKVKTLHDSSMVVLASIALQATSQENHLSSVIMQLSL